MNSLRIACRVAATFLVCGAAFAEIPGPSWSKLFPNRPADPMQLLSEGSTLLSRDPKAFSLVMTNGYGDCYRMNLLRNRDNYQAYRGVCSYRGFSLSGCSTTGEVVMLRIKATPSMPEHSSIVSTSLRWGTTMYFLNDLFHPLNSWVSAGYENWYPFDMSCSVAMYINSGGYGSYGPLAHSVPDPLANTPYSILNREDRAALFAPSQKRLDTKAFSLVMTNGYGDCYRMNLLRNRDNYQAYRGVCSYRGFSLSGCSTTGEVVMLRIKETPSMPEHFSLLSTSVRWGTTMYVLNDVFHPLNSWVSAGYENWYPFDMSCSVAFYINSGGYGAHNEPFRPEPMEAVRQSTPFDVDNGTGTNIVGALLPITGDLAHIGLSYRLALEQAMAAIGNTPGMPPMRLVIADTRTDAATAYHELTSMRTNGCHIVLGPESSEECKILKGYANENDVLLMSSSSTAPQLAIPNDNLMRLALDDSHQAREMAALLAADGITDIMIFSRSDIYGEGLMAALIEEHNALGGTVFSANYCPRATELIPEIVSNLASQVDARIAEKGANRVGVVVILFGEGVDVMAAAAGHPVLGSVRWYGADGMAENTNLLIHPAAADFAAKTRFVCSTFGSFTNRLYGEVRDGISAETGQEVVPPYPMTCYDGLRLIANALKQTGSSHTMASLKTAIKASATNYTGCTTPIVFNSADDLAGGNYDFYEVDEIAGAYHWIALDGKTPVAPENVEASMNLRSHISVSWNPVSGADNYELWMSATDQASEATKIAEPVSSEFDVTNAPFGAPCYFRVKAVNAAGTSGFSASAMGRRGAAARNDFDGDGKSDFAVFDPASGRWYALAADQTTVIAWDLPWGSPGSWPMTGDFDGDGKSDFAVFDPASGRWYALAADQATVIAWDLPWGSPGSWPMTGDFDGDGASDLAVFDSNPGLWYVAALTSVQSSVSSIQTTKSPAPETPNTDHRTPITAAPRVIAWGVPWGSPGSWPMTGDFDGDGASDIAVFDSNPGLWYVAALTGVQSSVSSIQTTKSPAPETPNTDRRTPITAAPRVIAWGVPWGWTGAWPVAGDFDGDGKNDFAVFDPASGAWYVLSSDQTAVLAWAVQFGWPGAVPAGMF